MKTERRNEEGFILALVLMVLAILTVFGMAMMMLSTINIESAGSYRVDQDTLNVAFTRYQRAQMYLMNGCCTFNDTAPTDISDCDSGNLLDSNDNGVIDPGDDVATSEIVCEDVTESDVASDPDCVGICKLGIGKLTISADFKDISMNDIEKKPDTFAITAIGEANGVKKSITAIVRYRSFLEFNRYIEGGNFTIPGHALSTGVAFPYKGDFFVGKKSDGTGGTLTIVDPHPATSFADDVYLGDTMDNPGSLIVRDHEWANVTIEGTLYEGYDQHLIAGSRIDQQMAQFRALAAANGLLFPSALGNLNCLDGSVEGGTNNLIDLSKFKCLTREGAADTVCTAAMPAEYVGDSCSITLPANFNGIIYWEAIYDLHVKGIIGSNGRGKSVGIFSNTRNIVIDGNISPGSGVDEFNLDKDGNPKTMRVYAGLTVSGEDNLGDPFEIQIANKAPIYLDCIAPIMSAAGGWRKICVSGTEGVANDDGSTIPGCASIAIASSISKPYDLNKNKTTELNPPRGWDEYNFDKTEVNILNFGSSVITNTSETTAEIGVYYWQSTNKNTILYNYSSEILNYPPPFPKVFNMLKLISYSEHEE